MDWGTAVIREGVLHLRRGLAGVHRGHAIDFQIVVVGLSCALLECKGGGEMGFAVQREKSRGLDGENQGAAVG